MSEASALPVTFAEGAKFRARQAKYLAFGLHVLRKTGFPLNSTYITEIYTTGNVSRRGDIQDKAHNFVDADPKMAYRIVELNCGSVHVLKLQLAPNSTELA